jgi:ELP3 family radical SAM enzyme/protein acetyltransferase
MADLEDIAGAPEKSFGLPPSAFAPPLKDMLEGFVDSEVNSVAFNTALYRALLSRSIKEVPSKRKLSLAYKQILAENPGLVANSALQHFLVHRAIRSASGILNISVSLPPADPSGSLFSCKYNCHFCPNEPGMPRSYLSNEAVFRRASEVSFNTVQQVYKRLEDLEKSGHTIDKIEFRVLGGTFSCYSHDVADTFIRDLYYGANTYSMGRERVPGTIEEEQALNVTAQVHVVGLGVETRPDEIKPAEIIRFRRYGITRVEMGVQHTDDALLRKVNRGHGVKQSRAAIRMLKDYGFKVEIHIMADLPGATPEGDKECYRQVLQADQELFPDYMKDYPCLDVDFSQLKLWKADGRWTPYAEVEDGRLLREVLVYRQAITPKWVRVNRIHRDFQEANTASGCIGFSSQTIKTNLAQIVKSQAEAEGIFCQCIRCCELRKEKFDVSAIVYECEHVTGHATHAQEHTSKAGMQPSHAHLGAHAQELTSKAGKQVSVATQPQEFFISAEVKTQKGAGRLLLGFIRLRLSSALENSIIPELLGKTAMIRELHVYGSMKAVGSGTKGGSAIGAQHLGIGKTLLAMAEERARAAGFEQMAVISGIGVRGYYQKNGYELRGSYMMKSLVAPLNAVEEKPLPPVVRDTVWDIYSLLAIVHFITLLAIYMYRYGSE